MTGKEARGLGGRGAFGRSEVPQWCATTASETEEAVAMSQHGTRREGIDGEEVWLAWDIIGNDDACDECHTRRLFSQFQELN